MSRINVLLFAETAAIKMKEPQHVRHEMLTVVWGFPQARGASLGGPHKSKDCSILASILQVVMSGRVQQMYSGCRAASGMEFWHLLSRHSLS